MKNKPAHFIEAELPVQVAIRWGTKGRSDNKHSQQDRSNKTGPVGLLHQTQELVVYKPERVERCSNPVMPSHNQSLRQ
jgi:hypothetical protein